MSAPAVSVVATTYTSDRLDDVRGMLASLAGQSRSPHQIVFVAEGDAAIADAVRAIGRELALPQLLVVENSRAAGLSGARNAASAYVTGDIVAFIDDDAEALENWIDRIAAAFERWPRAVGVTGRAIPLWDDLSASWLPVEFYWLISCTDFTGYTNARTVRNAWGMNMAFRRECLELVEFDERRGGNQGHQGGLKLGPLGEDTQFSLLVRQATDRPIVFDPEIVIRHRVRSYRITPRYVRRRAFWEGYTKSTLPKTGLRLDLAGERSVLRRLATAFLPRLAVELVRAPRDGLRDLRLAVEVLGHASIGYLCGRFPRLLGDVTSRYGS